VNCGRHGTCDTKDEQAMRLATNRGLVPLMASTTQAREYRRGRRGQ
jgi:hypothetical protein